MLVSLAPLRDRRERVMGYAVSSYPDEQRGTPLGPDEESRRTLELVPSLSRMVGRSLVVPVTPTVVREGAITRFASLDGNPGASSYRRRVADPGPNRSSPVFLWCRTSPNIPRSLGRRLCSFRRT